MEDIIAALENKNPGIKAETAFFLGRCFARCTQATLPKKLLKAFCIALLKVGMQLMCTPLRPLSGCCHKRGSFDLCRAVNPFIMWLVLKNCSSVNCIFCLIFRVVSKGRLNCILNLKVDILSQIHMLLKKSSFEILFDEKLSLRSFSLQILISVIVFQSHKSTDILNRYTRIKIMLVVCFEKS